MCDESEADYARYDQAEEEADAISGNARSYARKLREKVDRWDDACEEITLTRGEALDIARLLGA